MQIFYLVLIFALRDSFRNVRINFLYEFSVCHVAWPSGGDKSEETLGSRNTEEC
jgi:hypothetical protein